MHPTIFLYADYSTFSLLVINRLSSKGFPIIVITSSIKEWKNTAFPPSVKFSDLKDYSPVPYTHAIIIDFDGKKYIPLLLNGHLKIHGKTVLVTSAFTQTLSQGKEWQSFLSSNPTLKLFVTGDLLNPNIDNPLSQIIRNLVQKNEILIPKDNPIVYVTFIGEALNRLERSLFSYGNENIISIVSPISLYKFLELLKHLSPQANVKSTGKTLAYPTTAYFVSSLPETLNDSVLNQEIEEFSQSISKTVTKPKSLPVIPPPVTPKKKTRTIKVPVNLKKKPERLVQKSFITVLVMIWLFLFPFIPLSLAAGSYYFAYKAFISGSDKSFETLLSGGKSTAAVSSVLLNIYKEIPLLGVFYEAPYSVSQILESGSSLAVDVAGIRQEVETLTQGVLGKAPYDIQKTSENLTRDITSLYTKLSFFETTLNDSLPSLNILVPEVDKLTLARQTLSGFKDISRSLPSLLGRDGPVTYMVLLQNNMELRPTGGFIGSFALVTFENGKLIDTNVYDVYDADGQLKGFVKPPDPIVEHLGEPSWFLRDSNWDPNFVASANRAEWFLDKTLDRSVEGVIAIDLEVAKSILQASGPVALTDFNDEITADNMYEKIQHEVEEDFFPGSRKKTNYLTALANALVEKTKQLPEESYHELGKNLWRNILARDVQIALHNKDAHDGLRVLGWTGEMSNPSSCSDGCLSFPVGLVEANVGVNKANYHIERNATLNLEIQKENVISTLNIEYKNTSSEVNREVEHRYKNYVRVIAPLGSTLKQVSLITNGQERVLETDIKVLEDRVEVGVLVEIPPLQSRNLKFQWITPATFKFEGSESLQVQWRKQAGVPEHPVLVTYSVPPYLQVTTDPQATLTVQGNLSYNTTLSRDIVHTLSW